MRIVRYDDSNKQIKEEFADSFCIPLNQAKKSHLGISHLEREHRMFDSHENYLAYKMNEYGKVGAISPMGEKYADFIYETFKGATRPGYGSIGDDNQQEIWYGKKGKDSYDVFCRYEMIYEDAIAAPHLIIDSATKDTFNIRYALVVTENGYKVYDIYEKCFLNFTVDDSVSYINSEKKQVLISRSRYIASDRESEYTTTLIDFDGNVLGKIVTRCYVRFTDKLNVFELHKNGKNGILKLINGVFEEVVPVKYREITQIFDDKIVAINTQNCVKIVHFEKKMKKGVEVWANKLDSYKLPKEVVAGYFLEDESEGILTLNNGKKILFSLYLQGNDEKYQCEDIYYEGDAIFKCFQFKGSNTATITFMCNGQSINVDEEDSNDKDGHLVKIDDGDGEKYLMFTPSGTKLDLEIPAHSSLHKVYPMEKYYYNHRQVDFMRIPKDEFDNLIQIYCGGFNNQNYLLNIQKGTIHGYHYQNQMLWHNIYFDRDYYDLHTVRGDETFLKPFKSLIAGFDNYAVFDSWNSIYLIDRNLNVTEYNGATVKVDDVYQMCVVTTKDKAVVVSNDGVEEFDYTGRVVLLPSGMKDVYKSATSGNYVVDNIFVDANLLKYEAMTDTIDKKLATL